MQEYFIIYNGDDYSNVGYYFLGEKRKDSIVLNTSDLPYKLNTISRVFESGNEICYQEGFDFFGIKDGQLSFYEEFDDNTLIKFNKDTLRAEGNKFDKNLVEKMLIESTNTRPNLIKFFSKIIDVNENVKNHLQEKPAYTMYMKDPTYTMNYFNLLVFNLPEYEKLINSKNTKFLKNNLGKDDFEITEASKLHQVVGLPKFALTIIKDAKLEELITPIKDLAEVVDGNSLKIILEFIVNGKLIFDKEYSGDRIKLRIPKLTSFINYLTKILKRGNYKVTDLLNYFLRQSLYNSSTGYFTFPIDEAMYLNDYLDMCEKYDLDIEKYPSQLKRIHDIVSQNIIALEKDSSVFEKEFLDAVNLYKDVEKEIEISLKQVDGTTISKKYSFIVPTSIKDIVREGNIQHHCVGSYSDKIIAKESRVVFMRDSSDIKTPLVTIDIDKDYNLIEAKKAFNEDVDDEQLKVINKWLKEIKKF